MNDRPAKKITLSPRTKELYRQMRTCSLCPRRCGVDRIAAKKGACRVTAEMLVSSIGPHFGEESVLVGDGGSGTIFFAGCNLACVFCQNYDISHYSRGVPVGVEQLAREMLRLQDIGCTNVNLVTPTHVVAPVAAAIETARSNGLRLPIVYNCGGYESVEILRLLHGLIDIYMPDMKYADARTAERLSGVPNYPEVCFAAVREMHRQVGDLAIHRGTAARGLLVRHLVLPNNLAGSRTIFEFLAREISPSTAVNIMDQYRPCFRASQYPGLNRPVPRDQYAAALSCARQKGLRIID